MHALYKVVNRCVLSAVILCSAVAMARPAQADEPFRISVEISEITPSESCSDVGWRINMVQKTTISGARMSDNLSSYPTSVMRYKVQYVDGDVNLVHYWGSGYSAYVQDYMVMSQTDSLARIGGRYTVPLWSNTYEAVTVEYLLYEDRVVWETRASVECVDGAVAAYEVTTQAAEGNREDLPQPGRNLVLTLERIERYRNPFNKTGYLGTIDMCQTFFISDIYMPRASISTYARESITGQPMLIGGGPPPDPVIVDVHEDYGQPGGQPILDACAVK